MSTRPRGTLVAVAGLALAGAVFAVALQRAFTLERGAAAVQADAVPAPDPETMSAPAPLRTPSQAVVSQAEIAYAVEHDPFQPDRERPEPFRLPDEIVPAATPSERTPPPEFRMTGIVGLGDGGLALIETDGMTPRVLAVGESLLGYRLERVGATSATLAGHDEAIELHLVEGEPHPDRQGTRAQPFRLPAINVNSRTFSSDLANILRQARQRGMNQSQIQTLLQRLLSRQTESRVELPSTVIIRRRDNPDAPSRAPDNR
ncbi:MAG: hypothetical protein PVH00_06490 [Gemmatimonadota bacterium]|jgi:hypothetical protein